MNELSLSEYFCFFFKNMLRLTLLCIIIKYHSDWTLFLLESRSINFSLSKKHFFFYKIETHHRVRWLIVDPIGSKSTSSFFPPTLNIKSTNSTVALYTTDHPCPSKSLTFEIKFWPETREEGPETVIFEFSRAR